MPDWEDIFDEMTELGIEFIQEELREQARNEQIEVITEH